MDDLLGIKTVFYITDCVHGKDRIATVRLFLTELSVRHVRGEKT